MRPVMFLFSAFCLLSGGCKSPKNIECLAACGGNPISFGLDAAQYQASDIDTVIVRTYKNDNNFSPVQQKVTYYLQDMKPLAAGQRTVYIFEPAFLLVSTNDYEVEIVSTGQHFRVTDANDPQHTFMLNCAEEANCNFGTDVAQVSGGASETIHSPEAGSSTTYYLVFKKQ